MNYFYVLVALIAILIGLGIDEIVRFVLKHKKNKLKSIQKNEEQETTNSDEQK